MDVKATWLVLIKEGSLREGKFQLVFKYIIMVFTKRQS